MITLFLDYRKKVLGGGAFERVTPSCSEKDGQGRNRNPEFSVQAVHSVRAGPACVRGASEKQ